jgi:glycosyltransferase involved in cell wall biosynthesis
MKQSKTVLLTTIYPAAKNFMDSFFESLQKQTYKNFDILVINDGFKNFSSHKTQYSDLNLIEILSSESPAKNREVGIKKVIELGYKFLIFGDSDDFFSENRIQESIKALKHNDIVINELTLYKDDNYCVDNFLKNNLDDTNPLNENIIDGNIFGFSNIAIRVNIIEQPIDFNSQIIAVDWFFISTLFLQNKWLNIIFLKDVVTYYRQYNSNTIGYSLMLDRKKLDMGLKVKYIHYMTLINYCEKYNYNNLIGVYKEKFKQIKNLNKKLINKSFKNKYICVVNSNIDKIFSGWWSEIIMLEDFYNYEN